MGRHKGVKTFMMQRYMFDRYRGVLCENFYVILISTHPQRSCHKAFATLMPAAQLVNGQSQLNVGGCVVVRLRLADWIVTAGHAFLRKDNLPDLQVPRPECARAAQ